MLTNKSTPLVKKQDLPKSHNESTEMQRGSITPFVYTSCNQVVGGDRDERARGTVLPSESVYPIHAGQLSLYVRPRKQGALSTWLSYLAGIGALLECVRSFLSGIFVGLSPGGTSATDAYMNRPRRKRAAPEGQIIPHMPSLARAVPSPLHYHHDQKTNKGNLARRW